MNLIHFIYSLINQFICANWAFVSNYFLFFNHLISYFVFFNSLIFKFLFSYY